MRRAARWLGLGLGLGILALVLLGFGALAWLNSTDGLRVAGSLATQQVVGLRVDGLQSLLPWRLAAQRLSYADATGEWLVLDQAELRLDLPALLQRTLRITTLRANRLVLSRLPASADTPPAPPSDQLLPSLPNLPLAVRLDQLAIDRLELGVPVLGQAAVFRLQAEAEISNAELRASLTLEQLGAPGRVTLRLALDSGDRLEAELHAEDAAGGPLANLAGQPDQPLSLDARLSGPASGAVFTLRASLGEELAAEATGTVSATSEGALSARLQGQVRIARLLPEAVAPLASPLRFSLDAALSASRQVALHELTVDTPGGQARVNGSLDLATEAAELRASLSLPAATTFGPLIPAGLGWSGASATAQLSGTLARPRIAAEASLAGATTGAPAVDAALGPTPTLHLDLTLPEQRLSLRVQGAEARLEASGSAGEALDLNARLLLPRLAALGPGFSGSAEVTATARGPRQDPDVSLQASSDRLMVGGQTLEAFALSANLRQPLTRPTAEADLRGRYANLPVSLRLRARPEGDQVVLDAAEAGFGGATVNAEGSLDLASRLFSGAIRLAVPELARFAALTGQSGLAGQVSGEARLVPKAGAQGFTVRLMAPVLVISGQSASLRAQAEGIPDDFGFSLDGNAFLARLTTQGRAGVGPAGWRLGLARLEASGFGETLRLAAPARIASTPGGGIEIGSLALVAGRGGRLEARGRWGPQQAELSANLAALPLAFPLALLGTLAPELRPQGQLDAELRASGPVARPEFTLRLNATGLRAGLAGLNTLPTASLRAEARLIGTAYSLNAEAEAGSAGRLRASLRLPEGPAGALAGTLDGALDLGAIAAPLLAAGGDRVAGRLTLALQAAGSVAAPTLAGRATLGNASYRNLPLGVRLTDIGGSLVGDNDLLRLEGVTAQTPGGGRVAITGSLRPLAPGLPVELGLTARNARPVVSDLLTATLDADLRLVGPLAGGAGVAGRVNITRADIRVPETQPGSIATLPDVRQRGALPPGRRPPPPPVTATPAPPLALDLQVVVSRAFIRGRGLDAELAGEIGLSGSSADPVATGGLRLTRGTLAILARRLTFQRGNINFANGTLLPQLDFAANATSASTTLTVAVTGTPQAPEVRFSSSPDLPQDEILARLIFGRESSRLSPFEIIQLASAAAELTGTASTGGIVDRLRSGLGLDRLGVASDPNNANGAAVEAGRYVAPGLYLGVRQGTGGGTGVGVQYDITERLKLEGQTATGPAGDRLGLSYELEY